MSDPLRTEPAHDRDAPAANDAKIEQLLLLGLDQYFAARYELAINIWTRALFLDRTHPRARAYIERARTALAERQRESEELLQTGVAAFHRGEGDEARRLLQAAIEAGAPSDEALAVLDRLNRLETAAPPSGTAPLTRMLRARSPRRDGAPAGSAGAIVGLAIVAITLGVVAMWGDQLDWRSLAAFARGERRPDRPVPALAPVAPEAALPLPRRGEEMLARARGLAARGHLREALSSLESVRSTDPQKPDADRLRADLQRQLLALTAAPIGRGEPRNP